MSSENKWGCQRAGVLGLLFIGLAITIPWLTEPNHFNRAHFDTNYAPGATYDKLCDIDHTMTVLAIFLAVLVMTVIVAAWSIADAIGRAQVQIAQLDINTNGAQFLPQEPISKPAISEPLAPVAPLPKKLNTGKGWSINAES